MSIYIRGGCDCCGDYRSWLKEEPYMHAKQRKICTRTLARRKWVLTQAYGEEEEAHAAAAVCASLMAWPSGKPSILNFFRGAAGHGWSLGMQHSRFVGHKEPLA